MKDRVIIRTFVNGEEDYVAQAHERVYREEYAWGDGFSRYAKQIAYDFATKPKNPREELWVAELNSELVGSIMLVETTESVTGQIRLFLVDKNFRGLGIGKALTDVLLEKAKVSNYRKLILWSENSLTAARKHYSNLGFHFVESQTNHTWSLIGQIVTEEKWELNLSDIPSEHASS